MNEPSDARGELAWAIVGQAGGGDPILVVLPRETVNHWMARLSVLDCSTWGELREGLDLEVYQEVCGLCGYGSFDDYTANLEITGVAPLPGVHQLAAESYDSGATVPDDNEPFSPDQIPAYADGDWPPAVAYLMDQELPDEVLDEYAERRMTVFNGVYAEIPAVDKDAVLADLQTRGFRLVEEPDLDELTNWRQ